MTRSYASMLGSRQNESTAKASDGDGLSSQLVPAFDLAASHSSRAQVRHRSALSLDLKRGVAVVSRRILRGDEICPRQNYAFRTRGRILSTILS